jgi:hypothetical protein
MKKCFVMAGEPNYHPNKKNNEFPEIKKPITIAAYHDERIYVQY